MDWVLVITSLVFVGVIAAVIVVAVRHRHPHDDSQPIELNDAPLDAGFVPIHTPRQKLSFWSCPALENARRSIRRAWLGEVDDHRIVIIEHHEVQHTAGGMSGGRRGDGSGIATITRRIVSVESPAETPRLVVFEHTALTRFARIIGDRNPLKSDPEFARRWSVRYDDRIFAERALGNLREFLNGLPPRSGLCIGDGWLHLILPGHMRRDDFTDLPAKALHAQRHLPC